MGFKVGQRCSLRTDDTPMVVVDYCAVGVTCAWLDVNRAPQRAIFPVEALISEEHLDVDVSPPSEQDAPAAEGAIDARVAQYARENERLARFIKRVDHALSDPTYTSETRVAVIAQAQHECLGGAHGGD